MQLTDKAIVCVQNQCMGGEMYGSFHKSETARGARVFSMWGGAFTAVCAHANVPVVCVVVVREGSVLFGARVIDSSHVSSELDMGLIACPLPHPKPARAVFHWESGAGVVNLG